MNKVICDICGTVYPESSENCPVCGCSRGFGMDAYEEELLMEEAGIYPAPKKKNKEIFDFDEVNQDDETEQNIHQFDNDEEEEEPRSNTALVVILLVLIVLLLVTSAFIFLRYFLPNMVKDSAPTAPPETTVATVPVETEAEATEDTSVPCTDIVIPGGKIELGKDGMWLMNVQVYPADTTDVLTYASYDEKVATVSESGTVTAVGEGETIIEVICGIQSIKCNVIVDFSAVETTEQKGTIPALQVEETTEATEQTAESVPEETQPATESTEPAKEITGNTELKLKKTDVTIFSRYTSIVLELDCDIPAESIKWFTMDSTVAIVHDGKVTATGSGITRIYGEYGGQQVECIVRCNF